MDANNLQALKNASISDEALGRIWQATQKGYGILVPEMMVNFNGEQTIAWWQIDLETGETIGVGEDGTHQWLVKAAVFVQIFATTIILVWNLVRYLVARYIAWQAATNLTWETFWKEKVAEVSEDNPDKTLEEIYLLALEETKTYMQNEGRWDDFQATCRIEHPWLGEACGWAR